MNSKKPPEYSDKPNTHTPKNTYKIIGKFRSSEIQLHPDRDKYGYISYGKWAPNDVDLHCLNIINSDLGYDLSIVINNECKISDVYISYIEENKWNNIKKILEKTVNLSYDNIPDKKIHIPLNSLSNKQQYSFVNSLEEEIEKLDISTKKASNLTKDIFYSHRYYLGITNSNLAASGFYKTKIYENTNEKTPEVVENISATYLEIST